jgi:hypothetical protein
MHNPWFDHSIETNSIKALALDLDGTILHTDATLSERTASVLRGAMAQGIQVLIVTGRSPRAARGFIASIGATGPMVFYNGATVMDLPSLALKAATLLSPDIARGCVEIARQRDIHFHIFLSDDRLIYERHRPEAEQYAQRTGLYGEEQDLWTLLSEGGEASGGCIKGMFIAEAPVLDSLQVELDRRFNGRLYRARSHSTFLEVMAPGVSKGNGLRIALALRGIEPGQTMAFGDAENDIPMLEAAGIAVVPENATEEVKKMATLVVPSNDQDGPAQLLEDLLRRTERKDGTNYDR